MGSVLTIAGRDLRSLFNSPKGGAIFFFFLFYIGLFFNNFVSTFIEMQQRAPMMGGTAPTIDQLLKALFYNLHFILIFIIPAVTMATFAEEKKTQVFRLLQTAPVSPMQIVFGKYLAALAVMTLALAASAAFPLFITVYGEPDIGVILTSYLGIFLLIAAQIAFGLWVSSMTNNQLVAFLFTVFGLFLLIILNWLAPNLSGGGVTEGFLKYIASSEHLDVFFKGLITVKDVTYFVCFAALFLFFSNVVLDSQRWR